jgi:hypothetical protein
VRFHGLANAFVIVLFAAGIGLPFVQQALDILPPVRVVDNRALTAFPPLRGTIDDVTAFPHRFQDWYADHMGLRGRLVSGYRWLTDRLLRSPDKVVVGRDGWLYLRKGVEENVDTAPLMRDWCGRFAFSDSQLNQWVEAITANRDRLAARGIDYLFVVPPNKLTVLPGHLPARFTCQHGATRLDQLKQALARRSGIELVDFRTTLRRAAGAGVPIWPRTDTHWNARGITAAYPLLAARIRSLLPSARRIGSFEVRRRGKKTLGDLGRMIALPGLKPDASWSVRPDRALSHSVPTPFPRQTDRYGRRSHARAIDDAALPTALVLHDSFFETDMNRFLAEGFARSVFVFYARPDIDWRLVTKAQPDIVIQEMVERNLLHPFFPR